MIMIYCLRLLEMTIVNNI